MYDYLIVGAGLFGSVFAREMTQAGKKCLVIDKRSHIGGNCFTENVEGINVHRYGAHIFHTNNKKVWDYVNHFVEFNRFTNSPLAVFEDKLYNLPFNMNTFHQLWGVVTPQEAKEKIAQQVGVIHSEPKNLEEQAISLVGTDLYEALIKGYTKKQWGRDPKNLPAFIIKRLPLRFTYDNNYFNDTYQGIPIGGYTALFEKLLDGVEVILDKDFFAEKDSLQKSATTVVYTGMIDQYFGNCFGTLEYRGLRFEDTILDQENYQGNAVINYTEESVPFTRIIEHKHFEFGTQPKTVITREFPCEWAPGDNPYYPVNDDVNSKLFTRYLELARKDPNTIFAGRLAEYRYYDMHQVVENALEMTRQILEK